MNDGATEVLAPSGPATTKVAHAGQHGMAAVPTTPAAVLMHAMAHGGSMEQIEKLLDLQLKWESNEARKAYVADMAAFKRNPPTIKKDKEVGYRTKEGDFVGYKHATLGNVTDAIVEGLAAHGFSHKWDVDQQGDMVRVTCRITHRMGHSEDVSMSAPKDNSGKKNAIQQVASAITYLQRYTLLAATGLATHDQHDDDGASAGDDMPSMSDTWCKAAQDAASLSDLEKVWHAGAKAFERDGTEDEWKAFKDAVNARKAVLEPIQQQAQPGRSSRVTGIIKGNQQAANAGG